MPDKRLDALSSAMLRGIRHGIEKESLRVTDDGTLAETPHPAGLGSPLTHPHITTDFSESQLELITDTKDSIADCLAELTTIHQVVYRNIGDELLWCGSMPCSLPDDERIPIGQYGTSNIGLAKRVYRQGLANRYGRRMQTISGVHYNFSLPDDTWPALQEVDAYVGSLKDYRDHAYFALIRNFRRHAWVLLYLFGSSPAVCRCFVEGRVHRLRTLRDGTYYLPFATSLRMGPLGYQSDAQSSIAVSYNNLHSYAHSLFTALTEPYPPYAAIGVREGDHYRQLSTSLLQIENEFYGTIRPKRRIKPGERPLHALNERGVEYVEVRCMDLDPFSPIGIADSTARFLDVFLLYCLLKESPNDNSEEVVANARNQHSVAERGRDPNLRLIRGVDHPRLADWGGEIVRECSGIAAALDEANGTRAYRAALEDALAALRDPSATLSARMLGEMRGSHKDSYFDFTMARSRQYRQEMLECPLPDLLAARFSRMAADSLIRQREIEAADTMPFELFRRQYISQDTTGEILARQQSRI
ncbi:MAG: glutamate--cysteine ligase [Burkholderiales bacterium]|jgi:glutamate--cysteine ligase